MKRKRIRSNSIVYGFVYGDGQGCVLAKGYLDSYPGTGYRQPWLSRGYDLQAETDWLTTTVLQKWLNILQQLLQLTYC